MTEEICSSLFAEHSARTVETVKDMMTARSCQCENTLTIQMQEDLLSRFYNALTGQQAELGTKLESTAFAIRQEIYNTSLCGQKETVGTIEKTQKDLKVSHDATIERLNAVEEQLRDRLARAGLGIVDELKSVQTMGMEVLNKLSGTWRKNSAEMAQSQMQNVDKVCDS